MDRDRLTELLRTPSSVTDGDLEALRSMAERYPWFSGARLLLAVGEHNTGNLLAGDNAVPAAFLPSREVLFQLVRKGKAPHPAPMHVVKDEPAAAAPSPDTTKERIPAAMEEPRPETAAAEHPAVSIPPPAQETAPRQETAVTDQNPSVPPATAAPIAPKEQMDDPDHKASVPHAAEETIAPAVQAIPSTSPAEQQEEPAPDDAAPGASPLPAPAGSGPEEDVLARMYAESILASSYDLEHWEKPDVPVEKEAPAPEQPEPTVDHVAPPAASPETPATVASGLLSFTAWLDLGTAPAPPPETRPVPAAQPTAPPPPSSAAQTSLSQQEILDRFIRQDTPQPSKEKVAFFNPQQAAKQSLKDDGLVSETLAKIHEKQGNLVKAKEVYDRLAARHPEKSVYFAALSKALEARMNK